MSTLRTSSKKTRAIAFILALIMAMSLFPTLVAADNNRRDDAQRQQMAEAIEKLEANTLTVMSYVDGIENIVEISGIADFREAIIESYPQLSDYEVARAILRALGDTDEQIDSMPLELVLDALNYTAAIISESFFGIAYDGSKIEMTHAEFHADVARMEVLDMNPEFAPFSSLPSDTRTHGNLILRTRITRAYPASANRFMINAEAEWIRLPAFRDRNMLTIGHTSTANICNLLVSGASVRYVTPWSSFTDNATRTRNGTVLTMHPSLNGMSVSYHLAPPLCCCGPRYTVDGSLRLWHGITIPTGNTTNVMIAYGQRGVNFFGSMSASISGSGPSISFSPTQTTTTFPGWPLALRWNHGL